MISLHEVLQKEKKDRQKSYYSFQEKEFGVVNSLILLL
ncbi:hypothetical protein MHK_002860, partial [Candidatus Magnetomorum sp. HK-1]